MRRLSVVLLVGSIVGYSAYVWLLARAPLSLVTTYAYVKDKPRAPKGEAWDRARAYWETLKSDEGAHYDKVVVLDAASLPPIVSWGSSPEDVVSVQGVVPDPSVIADENKRTSKQRARNGGRLSG